MQANSLDNIHPIHSTAPVADAFADTLSGDIFNMKNFSRADWIVYRGVGTTGTTVVTVLASDDVSASNTTAIAFKYRTNVSGDTWGNWTDATTAGFTLAAGSNFMAQISVRDQALPAGKPYVQIVCTEGIDDPVLGGVLFLGSESRNEHDAPPTAIT